MPRPGRRVGGRAGASVLAPPGARSGAGSGRGLTAYAPRRLTRFARGAERRRSSSASTSDGRKPASVLPAPVGAISSTDLPACALRQRSIWCARGDQPRSANHLRNGSGSSAAASTTFDGAPDWSRVEVPRRSEPGSRACRVSVLRADHDQPSTGSPRSCRMIRRATRHERRRALQRSRMRVAARRARTRSPSCFSTEKANSPSGASPRRRLRRCARARRHT